MKKNSILIILSSFLAIYAILGFVAIPKIAKPQIEKALNENLVQKATLRKVDFNPFLLKFTAYDLKIFDEKETTISIEKLLIDFSVLTSIDEQHISFKDLKLVNPYINIIEYEDGTLNLQKLLKEKKEEIQEKKSEEKSNIKFQIYRTILDNAKIKFRKLISNEEPFKLDIDKLNYTFYEMGTYKNSLASHSLRILVNKNSELIINGGLRLDPFKMYGNVELKNFKPQQFLAYKKEILNFELNKETYLNLKFGYRVDATKKLKIEINDTHLDLNNLDLIQKDNSILSLKNFSIENLNLKYPENLVTIDSVFLNEVNSKAIIDKKGSLNYVTLINKPYEKPKEKEIKESTNGTESINPWKVNLNNFNIKKSNINFQDLKNSIWVDTKNINIMLNSFKLNRNDFALDKLTLSKATIDFKDSKNSLKIQNKELEVSLSNLASKNDIISLENANIKNSVISFKDEKSSISLDANALNINLDSFNSKDKDLELKKASVVIPKVTFKDSKNSLKILASSLNMETQSLNLNNSNLKLKKAKAKTSSLKFNDLKNEMDINTKNINLIATDTSFVNEKLKIAILSLSKPTISIIDNKNDKSILAKNIVVKLNDINNYKDSLSISKLNLHEPDLRIKDKRTKTDIFAKNIYLNVRKISNKKNKLKIVSSSINKPYVSIILGKQNSKTKDEKAKKVEEKKVLKVRKKSKEKKSFQFDIGPVNIKDMKMTFEDKNLPIPFKTDITKLNGKFSRLNSNSSKPTKLNLEGKVDKYGYTKITGTVDINDIKLLTDTNLLFKNIAVKNFTPYSGKFVGREIDSGKLNLDLKYNIKKSDLKAQNSVIIDKIKFGKTVKSPEAANLPLELAIALLEDSDGIIDINLPVTGNVDDPQFSIAPIVWKAFFNLIMKAVTSPFSLLGALLGVDEEQMKSLEFEFGKSTIIASEKEALDNIAKILNKKPKLAIKIKPVFDPIKDKQALQNIKFEKFLTKQMKKIPEGDEYKEALEDIFKEINGSKKLKQTEKSFTKKDKNGKKEFDNDSYIQFLKKSIVSKQKVSEDELNQIAKKRVDNILKYLLIDKKIPKESIIMGKIEKQEKQDSKWAVFNLDVSTK